MKRSFIVATFFMYLAFVPAAWSMTAYQGPVHDIYQDDQFAVSAGIELGEFNGESRELVHDPLFFNEIVSELVWDISDVVYSGALLRLQGWNRVQVNLGFWEEQSHNAGTVKDSDWLIFYYSETPGYEGVWGKEKLLFSESAAPIEKGKFSDINVNYSVLRAGGDTLSSLIPCFTPDKSSLIVDLIVGQQTSEWAWTAIGGTYNYFGQTGSFEEGVIVGTYEQDIEIPYMGVGVNTIDEKYALDVFFLYSDWASVEAFDTHPLRSLTFKDTVRDAQWSSFGFDFTWFFTERVSAAVSWERENLKKSQGDIVMTDLATGEVTSFPDYGGASHKNSSMALTVTVRS